MLREVRLRETSAMGTDFDALSDDETEPASVTAVVD
jgi:hypothetical protein